MRSIRHTLVPFIIIYAFNINSYAFNINSYASIVTRIFKLKKCSLPLY